MLVYVVADSPMLPSRLDCAPTPMRAFLRPLDRCQRVHGVTRERADGGAWFPWGVWSLRGRDVPAGVKTSGSGAVSSTSRGPRMLVGVGTVGVGVVRVGCFGVVQYAGGVPVEASHTASARGI